MLEKSEIWVRSASDCLFAPKVGHKTDAIQTRSAQLPHSSHDVFARVSVHAHHRQLQERASIDAQQRGSLDAHAAPVVVTTLTRESAPFIGQDSYRMGRLDEGWVGAWRNETLRLLALLQRYCNWRMTDGFKMKMAGGHTTSTLCNRGQKQARNNSKAL